MEASVLNADQNENLELLRRIKTGDRDALDILVCRNLGLVKKIAMRFCGRGMDYEDLMQIGVIGMIKAARSFDFEYNTLFSTYAVPLIIGEIKRFLRDDGLIKVGRTTKQNGAKIMSARETFIKLNGREPRISELTEITGIPQEEIVYSMEAVAGVQSLSEARSGDDESLTLESCIADESFTFDRITDKIALSEAIRKLPPLWREIITLRYFNDLSQNETGKRLGITQVKVSREEQKILGALKKALCS
jgi:RNA polymerase sporulation-specific sigma factor